MADDRTDTEREPSVDRDGSPLLEEVVPVALDGERLDRVVALLVDVSRNRAGATIDAGAVYVDGAVVTVRSRKVRADQELVVSGLEREAARVPAGDGSVALAATEVSSRVRLQRRFALALLLQSIAGNSRAKLSKVSSQG